MATINDFGIPGVGSGILQPKLKNRWRVFFTNFGGGAAGGGSDSQPVSMQVITMNRPQLSKEEIELHRYNSKAWVAGKHSWEPLTLTLQDDVSGTASRVIRDQIQKQQFLIGAEGPFLAASPQGSAYKFIVQLDMLDGGEQVLERWFYEGCWIKDCNWGDLDYSASEAVNIEVTIRFDHARQELPGFTNGSQGVATGGPGNVING